MIPKKRSYIFEGETEVGIIHLAHEIVELGYFFKEDFTFLQFQPVLRAALVACTLPLQTHYKLIPYHNLWHIIVLLVDQVLPLASLCRECPHLIALSHKRVPVMLHHQRHLSICE